MHSIINSAVVAAVYAVICLFEKDKRLKYLPYEYFSDAEQVSNMSGISFESGTSVISHSKSSETLTADSTDIKTTTTDINSVSRKEDNILLIIAVLAVTAGIVIFIKKNRQI